jgi:putative phosphoribosyl transferase
MNKTIEKNVRETPVHLALGKIILEGDLALPNPARGIVLFAHGSGSSRLSSRNRAVAGYLQRQGLATLLFDLLTRNEEQEDNYTMRLRFDIGLLASRLSGATAWLSSQKETSDLTVGYFGASTGGAAALVAETGNSGVVKAIVSRGGRPDLAGPALRRVKAPTLLIVGGNDEQVIELNEQAMEQLTGIKKLVIVPGATHLFEEPGTLDSVAQLAGQWFIQYLGKA